MREVERKAEGFSGIRVYPYTTKHFQTESLFSRRQFLFLEWLFLK